MEQSINNKQNKNVKKNRQNNKGGRTKRKNDKEELTTKKYCDKCDRLFRDCVCDEIERPERRQHNRGKLRY